MEDGGRAHAAIVGWACTTLCLVSYAAAFSQGASLSACTDMMPRHLRVQLHSSNSNYVTLHTNVSFYFPGDKVPVTVRSTRDYMGFMLQARKVSNNEIAGTFVFLPPGSKLLTCFEDGDTVTHSDKSLKRNLSFVWKAPDQPIGDIKFFISIVQSYFVYWAKIESAVVAQGGQNKSLADKKPNTAVPAPPQGPADPHPTAATGSLLPTSPAGIVATPAPEPDFGVGSDTRPVAEPKQSARTSRAVSGRSIRSRGWGLEPSLPTQDVGMVDALQGSLSQDNASSYSTFNGREYKLLERQTAERELAPQPEEAGTRGEEDKDEQEAAGNTLPWVTRAAPESAAPEKGEGPGRGTRLLAAQLGILLVCTAALGLALAAAMRCVCAQHCHKRAEVSFSEPEPDVITITENGEVMHFRKIRENSFVLVQAQYNWVSPSGGGKKAVVA
ncbi:reelin domain-containing protein 1 [Hirundo rustica]|nr:reelin domain-containing protein 1 [Hirundo rustica]